jgi:hypothetical protein
MINIPGFTAKASLCKSSGHYRTSGHGTSCSSPFMKSINAAMNGTQGDMQEIDCSNCVGGECAQLGCFETWAQGGGGLQRSDVGDGAGQHPPPLPNEGIEIRPKPIRWDSRFCCPGGGCVRISCPCPGVIFLCLGRFGDTPYAQCNCR